MLSLLSALMLQMCLSMNSSAESNLRGDVDSRPLSILQA